MVARDVQKVETDARWAIPLSDVRARDVVVAGSKAARLAEARAAGLPVLEGFVLTVGGARRFGVRDRAVEDELRHVWASSTGPVIVRSSSPHEDLGDSSMAGMFTSVLDVGTWKDFVAAIVKVVASARGGPMAVLVQPQLDARRGGVMFGLDPVSGRRDRLVVATVSGTPDALVSGRSNGTRTLVTIGGRRLETSGEGPRPTRFEARRLAALAAMTEKTFGAPQDVEWAIDRVGKLWLLQSRPITAVAPHATATGPVFGPGPIAETFPDTLAALELDLWVRPLEDALRVVLPLVGAATEKAVDRSPVVVDVAGRVAVDLRLFGALPRRGFLARIDPRPPLRRLAAGWRVGRLRAALPALARHVIQTVDGDLARVPALTELSERRLLDVLTNARMTLTAVYGHELMAGLLADVRSTASVATRALVDLAAGRDEGLSDEEIVARYPSTLALVPPRIGGSVELPRVHVTAPEVSGDGSIDLREELRLRSRLLQELGARIAHELGRRLTARDVLIDPAAVRSARLDELVALVEGDIVALSWQGSGSQEAVPVLPTMFRLADDGTVVDLRAATGSIQGVSAGRATGTVFDGTGTPPTGAILVVRTLDPTLAPLLPVVKGVIAETGNVLSHLAILAREFGIPAVVGVPDAVTRFVPGTKVYVDGSNGDVRVLDRETT